MISTQRDGAKAPAQLPASWSMVRITKSQTNHEQEQNVDNVTNKTKEDSMLMLTELPWFLNLLQRG